jgi:tetratricopeptide (TPR) repeat protein
MTDETDEDLFAPRASRMIGRDEYIKAIRAAIADTGGRSHVLYFFGPGGIGKTRLLEELAAIRETWTGAPFRCTGIIDLYHADYHSPGGLRMAIADGLDPDNTYFQHYRALRDEFEGRRQEGASSRELEDLRGQFDTIFQEEYALLAGQQRLVLRFDTLELLQYESDLVQQICQVQDADTAIKTWLVKQICHFPNTVTLFAGRPHARIQDDVQRILSGAGRIFKSIELAAFTQDETQRYLHSMCESRPDLAMLKPEVREQIYQITRGRPIYLALLIDLMLHKKELSHVFPITTGAVRKIDEELIGAQLFERLIGLSDAAGQIIRFLIYARKGLDAGLMCHLDDSLSAEQVEELLAQARGFAIVKVRPDTTQLFLHDEVYDLCDRYFRDDLRYGGEFTSIAEYYRQRLAQAASSEQREDLMIALLYYELQIDVRTGYYSSYALWNEDAIKHYELGLDMRLRNEMLRFVERYTNPKSPFYSRRVASRIDHAAIDRDGAVRWVKRYLVRGDFEKARQVADALRACQEPAFDWEQVDDLLYKADLLHTWGEVLAHVGAPQEQSRALLEQAIKILESDDEREEHQSWRSTRILGRAHNTLGYFYRTRGRYGLAWQEYKRALRYFKQASILDELANTQNNLAFLLALLGRANLAQHHIDQALEIRRRIGHSYPIALSHNTRGLIYVLQNHPEWGVNECEEGLQICEELQEQRGIGLTCNGLGFALRKLGDQWKLGVTTPREAEGYFTQAEAYLGRAARIFSEQVPEPIRLWEAYNELGSLYCDWGWLTRCTIQHPREVALEYYDRSIAYQEQALEVAREHDLQFPDADSCDDLAQVYGDRSFLLASIGEQEQAYQNHDLAEYFLGQAMIMATHLLSEQEQSMAMADSYLDQVVDMVPADFHLASGEGFREAPEPGETYWLALGKVHLQRGVWAFRSIERDRPIDAEREEALREGIRHFTFATAYLQRFWPQSFALDNMLRAFAKHLANADPPPEFTREIAREIVEEYKLNLTPLLETIDNVLGI